MIFSRKMQVKIIIGVLLYFGNAGLTIGGWEGMTYIFEPLDTAANIGSVKIAVNTTKTKNSDHVILKAGLDRVGRCSFEVFYKAGGSVLIGPSPTLASTFQVVATKPGKGYWYDLASGLLPDWIDRVVVRTYKVGWDLDLKLVNRKCVEYTLIREPPTTGEK